MELTAELFEELLFSVRPGRKSAKDTRKAPRVGIAATVTIQRLAFGEAKAKIRDISLDGLCLVTRWPIPPCERIIIDLPCKRGTPLTLILETIRCERVGDGVYHQGMKLVNHEDITREVAEAKAAAPRP